MGIRKYSFKIVLMPHFEFDLETIKRTAVQAGKVILEYYQKTDLGLELKSDQSPLTLADKAAHKVIMEGLANTGIPVLSEEGEKIPYQNRKNWSYFWMVDPLDGTKEFVKRNGEFTVNIALIDKGKAVFGVVYAPVLGDLYWGKVGNGAWKRDAFGAVQAIQANGFQTVNRIVASRSHLNEATREFLKNYPEAELISMGSSLKLLLVAEGKAQLYPRPAPTMEWDTAAAHAIVKAAGGKVLKWNSEEELSYNKEDLLNPWFLVKGKS